MQYRYEKMMNLKAFTLIELLTVLAIIAILASIALPAWIQYRSRAFDQSAHVDIKNAYIFSQAHFSEKSNDVIDLELLKKAGFRQTKNVIIDIVDGNRETLIIECSHDGGTIIFSVNSVGVIDPPLK